MNQLIETAEAEAKKEEQKKSKTGAQMARMAEFDFFLTPENIRRMFPMIMFMAGLAILYIANAHYADKLIRKNDKLSKDIKELRSEYITIKSDLMYRSMQSEVGKRLSEKGVKELVSPPKKIVVKEE
jgi:hypothetical protein